MRNEANTRTQREQERASKMQQTCSIVIRKKKRTRKLSERKGIKDQVGLFNPDPKRREHENSARARKGVKDAADMFNRDSKKKRTRKLSERKGIKDQVGLFNPDPKRREHENSARGERGHERSGARVES